jgi:hypothetical protein
MPPVVELLLDLAAHLEVQIGLTFTLTASNRLRMSRGTSRMTEISPIDKYGNNLKKEICLIQLNSKNVDIGA